VNVFHYGRDWPFVSSFSMTAGKKARLAARKVRSIWMLELLKRSLAILIAATPSVSSCSISKDTVKYNCLNPCPSFGQAGAGAQLFFKRRMRERVFRNILFTDEIKLFP